MTHESVRCWWVEPKFSVKSEDLESGRQWSMEREIHTGVAVRNEWINRFICANYIRDRTYVPELTSDSNCRSKPDLFRQFWKAKMLLELQGQEVFGALHPTAVQGTYTDYAILLEDELTAKPVSISHVEAISFAALTAWRALKSTARITQGQRVLVVSGGGAISFATIQLAVTAEYHVSTTCGSESIDRAMATGAEQAVDYTTQH
ncbi:hypothetical protein LOK49_LG12G01421 [Camellia lanceoleosa]|uniref:Uncharacterized protein n=1 Tax=Camellia lanceoleosa TaxID=1840588 RepID=A0ACC0FV47_9ERIC|nr:hypothetical protein LOK49_LG12G01421 [Camellia lanceoleosa]